MSALGTLCLRVERPHRRQALEPLHVQLGLFRARGCNGVVYVGSFDDRIYALNASTGAELWSYLTSDSVLSSPTVASESFMSALGLQRLRAECSHGCQALELLYW